MPKAHREDIWQKILTILWLSSISVWSFFSVRQFPFFIILFSLLSLVLIWRALVLFYGIKIENGEIFIAQFRQWRRVRPEEVKILNVENSDMEIYIDKLNFFNRASIPMFFSRKNRPEIVAQVKSILATNPEIKIILPPK